MSHRNRSVRRPGMCIAMVASACLVVASTGCKGGTSGSRPSLWSFGSGSDPSKLAAAPPFDESKTSGGVAKPSNLASPYPTTTTPEGYAIDGSGPKAATQMAAVYPSTDNAAPITYGQPAAAPTAYPTTAAAVIGASSPSTAIGPQAGPYATLPSSPPSAPGAAPSFESPAGGMASASIPAESVSAPAARVADSRFGGSFGDPPAASGTQYDAVGESRFSGSRFTAAAAPPAAEAFSAGAAPSAPIEPRLEPARDTALQPSVPPAALVPPAADPASSLPSTPPPPRRRPDPGYRPGGTSSYRPNRAILVGEPVNDPAVRTAGFESSADPLRQ